MRSDLKALSSQAFHEWQNWIDGCPVALNKLQQWDKEIQSWLQHKFALILQEARGAKLWAIIEGGADVTRVLELHCESPSKKMDNFPANFQMIFFNMLRVADVFVIPHSLKSFWEVKQMDAFWNSAAVAALFRVPARMEGSSSWEVLCWWRADPLANSQSCPNVVTGMIDYTCFYSRQLGKLEYRLFYRWNKQSSCWFSCRKWLCLKTQKIIPSSVCHLFGKRLCVTVSLLLKFQGEMENSENFSLSAMSSVSCLLSSDKHQPDLQCGHGLFWHWYLPKIFQTVGAVLLKILWMGCVK